MNNWLENDANNLGFYILNDDEIVDSRKEWELSSEDAEEYNGPKPSETFAALESAK